MSYGQRYDKKLILSNKHLQSGNKQLMRINHIKTALLTVMMLLLVSCSVSYKFNGASIDYTKTKTIQIADFPIRSSYVWAPMASIFNNQLKDVFANHTRLIQVKRNGDMKIEGEITQYSQRNKAVTAEGTSAQAELSMTVNVRFTNNANHSEDFEKQFTATSTFETTQSLNSVQEELVTQMVEDITDQIFNATVRHPEQMDKETLYDLRSLLALYPYYQPARLLLLQNLYLLHDPSFDEELRRSAVYITDRKVVFNLVEAAHYKLRTTQQEKKTEKDNKKEAEGGNRTISLIEQFLDTIPEDKKEEENKERKKKRKPTPADAAIDYVAYLLDTEGDTDDTQQPVMKGQDLIDNFINNENGKIELKDEPEYVPEIEDNDKKEGDENYFTETLAQIYIKQGRYSKALEIIKRLNLNYPKKNAYFADQIRFLEKLIINNKYK